VVKRSWTARQGSSGGSGITAQPNDHIGQGRSDESAGAVPHSVLTDTDWSLIDRAALEDSEAERAMEQLSRRYWPVIYGYARSSGCDVHEASDITQGFMCDVVLHGKLLQRADKERGRFRMLLRTAVRHYLIDHRRRKQGRGKQNREHAAGGDAPDHSAPDVAPADVFDAQWAGAMIRRVLMLVRRHYYDQCQEAYWEVFTGRVVRPMLLNEPPTAYAALIERFDLTDASQASNMMITVKRRFARTLRDEVARTVSDPIQVDGELCALLSALEQGASS